MRDILFRAKDLDGKWVYGGITDPNHEIENKTYIVSIDFDRDEDVNCFIEAKEDTVGQFTGLTDKNGNKIFEGDIIKVNHNSSYENPLLCEWDDYNACFKFTDKYDYDCAYFLNKKDLSQNEIIGNMYDNPELLK